MNRLIAIVTLATLGFIAPAGYAQDGPVAPRAPWAPARPKAHAPRRPPLFRAVKAVAPAVTREITSERCATSVRAEANARTQLAAEVKNWLAESGVDRSWTPPKAILDDMVVGSPNFTPETLHDGDHELNVVRATITADFSETRKHELLDVYGRQIGGQRLAMFGGGLFVILASLAAISGYIRADEATKGYYTNRLRLLAAAGVGAAGVAVYHILT